MHDCLTTKMRVDDRLESVRRQDMSKIMKLYST